MGMAELFAYQGFTKNYQALQINNNDGTAAVNVYTSGSVLSATVGVGQNFPPIFSPVVNWQTTNPITQLPQTGYGQGQFSISFTGTSTAPLDPAGEYYVYVNQNTSGVSSVVWMGRLKILATPGSSPAVPPNLATYDFVEAYCSSIGLTDPQRDNVPYFTAAASDAIRRKCNRNFDLRTYVKKFDVTTYGAVRLDQVPIQIINRVQGPQQLALTVSNNSTSVQFAQAYFAYTGVPDGYTTNLQTATGITLNWSSNGVLNNQTVAFTSNQTILSLANAINSAWGSAGWQAVADTSASGYGYWPVTELDGGYTGQGAALTAIPGQGAQFYVLQDLSNYSLDDQFRGFLNVGRQQGNFEAGRWGPGGDQLWSSPVTQSQGQVKVTFTAGYSPIPMEIQLQCAELVKWKISLSKTDQLLESEKAADYEYKLALDMVRNMPPNVVQALGPWVLYYA